MAIDPKVERPTRTMLGHAIRYELAGVIRAVGDENLAEYLSRVALGTERMEEVFSIEGVGTIPLFATAKLLLKFGPQEKEWWEYLDQIWDAAEAAERTSLAVLPALMLCAHKEKPN